RAVRARHRLGAHCSAGFPRGGEGPFADAVAQVATSRLASDRRDSGFPIRWSPRMKTNERFLFVRAVAFLVALGALAAGAVAQTIADVVDFDPDYGIGETERLSFDAGEVVYLEKGRGSSVVFYYPAFDHRYWQWQVDAAAAAGYRAIALSFAQPSADTQDPPLSAAAQNDLFDTAGLASALDELALGPVHFVAHSIG